MKKLFVLAALLLSASVFAQQTTTVPAGGSVTVTCAAPVVTPPPASATSWVYHGGKFSWLGDWSFSASVNYADTVGNAPNKDIALTLKGQWGGWLPYPTGQSFSLTPYKTMTIGIKPTVANAQAQIYFMKVGDVAVGNAVNPFIGKYGAAPVIGVWNTYNIPLSDFGVTGVTILKFAVQDQTGRASGTAFYLNDVGFL